MKARRPQPDLRSGQRETEEEKNCKETPSPFPPARFGGAWSGFPAALRRLSIGGWFLIALLWSLWLISVPLYDKAVALWFALAFMGVETTFTFLTDGFEKCGSTPEQFFVNLFYLPLLLPPFWAWMREVSGRWGTFGLALQTPVFIWILEIVEGYSRIGLFGYCRAWQYNGRDAFFHGTVKLSFYPLWAAFGFITATVCGDFIAAMQGVTWA
uniref:Uncharacterized protein n=1 Tax=Chromera velia CCMP2878 TaxID=1169474 RepID=A0A0G4F1D6_9ALVE|eukprot:Cvel_14705.t1-p1 / transcript=Cvel_14705.t1 / gene=Cvel_14705 / organism=Chromera_velia_CCMP2878 / gene_product=hypothetical protein / transcript_product=hypothetical protein / location=Cvel_scaffold1056:24749-25381(+) / protein_length=211 / sequence_SO=supercontig / SO=protein_coding / is_pseudo=false